MIFYKFRWVELELIILFHGITPRMRYSPSSLQIIKRCDWRSPPQVAQNHREPAPHKNFGSSFWLSRLQTRNLNKPIVPSQGKSRERWCPPAIQWCKADADRAFSKDYNHGGGGVVSRDHRVEFRVDNYHFFHSNMIMKAPSCWRVGRRWLLAKKLIMETGSSGVALELRDNNKICKTCRPRSVPRYE
jgi:hypothetical protein